MLAPFFRWHDRRVSRLKLYLAVSVPSGEIAALQCPPDFAPLAADHLHDLGCPPRLGTVDALKRFPWMMASQPHRD